VKVSPKGIDPVHKTLHVELDTPEAILISW
jgi:hypothetical protein